MSNFHRLPADVVVDVDRIERQSFEKNLDTGSAAVEVFTDFSRETPILLELNTPIDEAVEIMQRTHVRLSVVVDPGDAFRGIVRLADLLSSKVALAAKATGLRRNEMSVKHVMTPRKDLHAISVRTLRGGRVGDVLATMDALGEEEVLVVDEERDSVRGILSAANIARALHTPVRITSRARSFAEVYQAMKP